MKYTILLLLFFVFSFLFRTDLSFDQDLGRHLKLGEIIVKTHQVPKVNLFSYTNPDFPFINTHWLFEVIVYGFSQTIGLQAFLILKVFIFLLSVWLILKIVPKENKALLLPVGFIFLHVLRERLELRPEIFSFLFTALTYYILEKYVKEPSSLRASEASVAISQTEKIASSKTPRNDLIWKPILFLPIIQLIWINTHIYFFIGLILQVTYIIYVGYQALRSRASPWRLEMFGIVFGLSVLVSLINPNGLKGLLYPLNVNQNYGYTIVENQTMFLLESINFKDPNFIFVKLCWGIIIASIIIVLLSSLRRQGSNQQNNLLDSRMRGNDVVKNILLALFGLILSLVNVRSFPYLVFLSLPAILQMLGPIKFKNPIKILNFIFMGLLIIESIFYLNGQYYKSSDSEYQSGLKITENGKRALDFVLENDLPNPIFNNFDIGSYIIYRGYPRYKVFVDGRPESYPAQFFTNTYIPAQYDYSKFKTLEKEINFKTIIFSHTDQTPWGINFLQSVVKDTDWKLVFIDDFIVIFVKEDTAGQKALKIIDLAKLDPTDYKYENHVSYLRLGLFLLRTQNTLAGKKFIEKAAQIYPHSPTVTSLLTL